MNYSATTSSSVSGVTISSGENIYVFAGGTATDDTVNSGADEYIYASGAAISTVVSSGGHANISSGGTATATTVGVEGFEVVFSGGMASNSIISGSYNATSGTYGAEQVVSSGGAAIGATIYSADFQSVLAGGTTTGTVLSGTPGGRFDAEESVSGASYGTIVNSGGAIFAESGGTIHGTVASSGGQILEEGGTGSGSILNSGASEQVGYGLVFGTGVAVSTTVNSGSYQTVYSGSIASDTIVNSGGAEYVSSGGTASGTAVGSGGDLFVSSGGTDISATLSSGGLEIVSSGGTASGTTVSNGGNLFVSSGGTDISATLSSGGLEIVSSGGTVSGVTVLNGGTLVLLAGAQAVATNSAGGSVVSANILLLSGSTVVSAFSGTVSGLAVPVGELAVVQSGGATVSTTVSSGGAENVSAGGTATGTTVQAGGNETVFSGGIASGSIISGVNSTASGTYLTQQHVESGGSAVSATFYSFDSQMVAVGGTTTGTVLKGTPGASFPAEESVSGKAYSTTVSSGGVIFAASGGTIYDTVVSSGGQIYEEGGSGSGAILSSGASEQVGFFGTGTATSTTVGDGSYQTVYSGSVASVTVVNGGTQYVSSGGVTIDTDISGSASISGGSIHATGFERVLASATAFNTRIDSGGAVVVSSRGVTSGSIISGATLFSGATAFAAAYENVYSGGIAVGTEIGSGGAINVSSGGATSDTTLTGAIISSGGLTYRTAYENDYSGAVASDTDVGSGGILYVYGSGLDTTVSGGGRETVYDGGVASGTVLTGITSQAGGVTAVSSAVEVVSGGSAIDTQVKSGGRQTVSSGGTLSGSTVSSGGLMVISSGGLAVGAQFLLGANLELNAIPFVGSVTPHVDPSTGLLTVMEGGNTYTQQLAGNYAGEVFSASVDSAGTGTLLTLLKMQKPRNGPPVLQAPTSATITQYAPTPLSFGVSETGDTSKETFTVVLSDATGELSSDGVDGVSGSETPFLTMSGTLTQVQDDLTSLEVTENNPVGNEAGTDTIYFSASDSLGGSSGPTETELTINPQVTLVIDAPTEATVSIARPTPINGVSLSEVGALDDETFRVTVTDSGSVIAATGGSAVVQLSPGTIAISGSLGTVNAALATLMDTSPDFDSGILSIEASDSLQNTADPSSTYVLVADNPSITTQQMTIVVPSGQSVELSSFVLSETGAAANETFVVTLTDVTGTLSAEGPGVSGVGTDDLTVSGSLAVVNQALSSLTVFESTAGEADTLIASATDSLGGQTQTNTQVAVYSEALSISAQGPLFLVQGNPAPVRASISDEGAITGETFTVVVSDTTGLLSAEQASGTNSNYLLLTGTLSDVNAALATLSDTDGEVAPDTINVQLSDSYENSIAASIAVGVMPLVPSISAPSEVTAYQANAVALPLVISEANSVPSETFVLDVSAPRGTFSTSGISTPRISDNDIQFSGTLSSINSDLKSLTFSDATAGQDQISLQLSDSFENAASAVAPITVFPLIPTLSASSKILAVEGVLTPVPVIVAETNNVAGETFTVTASDMNGILTVAGSQTQASGSGTSVSVSGSLSSVNAALASLTDSPFAGADNINLSVSDSFGNTASASTEVDATQATGFTTEDALAFSYLADNPYSTRVPKPAAWDYTVEIGSGSYNGLSYAVYFDSKTATYVFAFGNSVISDPSGLGYLAAAAYIQLGQIAGNESGALNLVKSYITAPPPYLANGMTYYAGLNSNIVLTGAGIGAAAADYVAENLALDGTVPISRISGITFGSPPIVGGASFNTTYPNFPITNYVEGDPPSGQEIGEDVAGSDYLAISTDALLTSGYGRIGSSVYVSPSNASALADLVDAGLKVGLKFLAPPVEAKVNVAIKGTTVVEYGHALLQANDIESDPLTSVYPVSNIFNVDINGLFSDLQNYVQTMNPVLGVAEEQSGAIPDGSANSALVLANNDDGTATFTLSESDGVSDATEVTTYDNTGNITQDQITFSGAVFNFDTAATGTLSATASGDLLVLLSASATSPATAAIIAYADGSDAIIGVDSSNDTAIDVLDVAPGSLQGTSLNVSATASGDLTINIDISDANAFEVLNQSSPISGLAVSVDFASPGETLALDVPGGFDDVIFGFAAGETISLADLTVSSAALNADDVLSLTAADGAATLQLDPSTSYAAESFLIGANGHGGSVVVAEDDTQTLPFTGPNQLLLVVDPAQVNGSISGFATGDTIDLAGFAATSVSLGAGDTLQAAEADGSLLSIQLGAATSYAGSLLESGPDGNGGMDVTLSYITIQPTDPVIEENAGSETFTLTRSGDTAEVVTVYVSTTDGTSVAGESTDTNAFTALNFQPITFSSGSADATATVNLSGSELASDNELYGLVVTDAASVGANVLATDSFTLGEAPANPVYDASAGAVQSGNEYVVDLGTLAQGDAGAVTSVSILNDVTFPGDDLNGSFNVLTAGGFDNEGFGAVSFLRAGDEESVGVVQLETDVAGTFSETIEFLPSSNVTGSSSQAPAPQVLVIQGTVLPASDGSDEGDTGGDVGNGSTNNSFRYFPGTGSYNGYGGGVGSGGVSSGGGGVSIGGGGPGPEAPSTTYVPLPEASPYLPVPLVSPRGGANGEPHLGTFTGGKYDFQAVGEFVLAQSTTGSSFTVQARLSQFASSPFSVITQVAIEVGAKRVTFDASRSQPLWIDGEAASLSSGPIVLAGGTITQSGSGISIHLATGENVTVSVDAEFSALDVGIALEPGATHYSVNGLLGDDSGNKSNDLTLADGTPLARPLDPATLYGAFAASWRVTDTTSLLDYGPGQDTATFTDKSFPGDYVGLAAFPSDLVTAAEALVQQAGVADPGLQDAVTLDYLVSGDPSFLTQAASLEQEGLLSTDDPVTAEQQPSIIGVYAPQLQQIESASGPTTVQFLFYRTGDASAPLTLNYAADTPDSTFLSAADFGGALPSGTVTFGAGESRQTVSITVPTGIGTAVSKSLELRVSAPAGVIVGGLAAQTELIAAVPTEGSPPVFGLDSSSAAPVQSGNDWTLDLGTITQGSSPAADGIRVLNNAVTGSDSLDGYLTVTGDGGIATSFSPSFLALQPNAVRNIINVVTDTSQVGAHTESVTFNLFGSNITGFDAAIASQALTITSDVTALAPTFTSPPAVMVTENVATVLSGLSIAEPDSVAAETFTAALTDMSGMLSATGVGVSGAGTADLGISGSLQQVDAALATLSYASQAAGSDQIELQTTDSFGNIATGSIDVTVAPPTPVLTTPSTLTVPVGQTTGIFGLGLQEPGSPDGTTITANLSDIHGALSVLGSGVTGSGTPRLSVTGTLSQVDVALQTLTDLEESPSPDTITLNATDSLGNHATATSIAVTVNGLPVITTPTALTIMPGAATAISGVSLAESGDVSGETFTVSLTDTDGLLGATGAGVTGANSTELTISGSLAEVNTDLETLSDTSSALASDSIVDHASDSFGNTAVAQAIAVTVLPALTITRTQAQQGISDQATIAPFAHVTIAETGSVTETAQVAVSATADGTLSDLGAGSYDPATGVYTVSGSPTAVTTALDALVFTPTPFQAAPGAKVTTGFNLSVRSSSGATATDDTTSVVATAAGVWDIAAGARLEIPGSSHGQTVDFLGTASLLVLDQPALADLTVTGFVSGDHIELAGVDASAAPPVLTDGTLSIGTLKLGFSGDYTGEAFSLVTAADGDAELTVASISTLGGHGRTLRLGSADGNVVVSGYSNSLTGTGSSDDLVQVGGLNNSVTLGNGNDAITTLAGSSGSYLTLGDGANQVNLGGTLNTVLLGNGADTVAMSGSNNSVTAGNGQDSVTGGTDNEIVLLGNGDDTVEIGGFGNSVTVGDGNDTVDGGAGAATIDLGKGDDSVTLNGRNNTVTGGDGNDSVIGGRLADMVTLGNGNDTVQLAGSLNVISLGDGRNTIAAGSGQDSLKVGGGSNSITLAGSDNVVVAGNGDDTVTGTGGNANSIILGDGADMVQVDGSLNKIRLGDGADSVRLTGLGNTVTAGNGGDTVTGGADNNTVTVGTGTNTVSLGGWGNSVTVGGGTSTVDAGLGTSTIRVDAGTVGLTLHGRGDMVFLHNAAQVAITDHSAGLALGIDSGDVVAAITGFGATSGAMVDLAGAGFSSVAQVMVGLQSDGHGGSMLALGGTGSLDFFNLAPASLHANNFSIT